MFLYMLLLHKSSIYWLYFIFSTYMLLKTSESTKKQFVSNFLVCSARRYENGNYFSILDGTNVFGWNDGITHFDIQISKKAF